MARCSGIQPVVCPLDYINLQNDTVSALAALQGKLNPPALSSAQQQFNQIQLKDAKDQIFLITVRFESEGI